MKQPTTAFSVWLLLAGAILCEVVATLSLRLAIDRWEGIFLVIGGYLFAFILLARTLNAGTSVGVAYGIWGASGVALVATFGVILFDETLSLMQIIGIGFIIVGVIVIQGGSAGDPEKSGVKQ